MTTPLNVLIVEDRPEDAELMVAELARAGFDSQWRRVDTEPDFLAALDPPPDVILADHSMPKFDPLLAIRLLKERDLHIPLIMVSGVAGDETGVAYMKEGAADYLLKDRMARLGPAVQHALDQRCLREEKERAEQEAERAKDEFFAIVSHELLTPLTSITGYVDVLSEGHGGEISADCSRWLAVIRRNAERLQHLVDNLLLVAQVQAETLVLERGRVELGSLAARCVESARPLAKAKGVDLSIATDHVEPLPGDPSRVAQVLDNLLSNALKFTSQGEQVRVKVWSSGDLAMAEVTNTGSYITPKERSLLFERFGRTSTAVEQVTPGAGLGLVISKAIVEAHGGGIGVESERTQGTAFRVWLPIRQPPNGSAGTAASRAATS